MDDYILPADAHIGRAHLKISNLEQSLRFYSGLLGFEISGINKRYVSLTPKVGGMPLLELSEIPGAVRKPPRTSGLFHIAIRLPGRAALGSVLQRLLENQYPLQGGADHLVSEAIYLADPDGNGLELYCDRPRKSWHWRGDQVAMSTEPVDAQGLLEAAALEAPMPGIHPETDIGHIHLQAADLGRSEAFYCGLLGFQVTQRDYPGALFVSAGGYHHHIGLNIWAGRGAPPPPANAVGLESFQVAIPDTESRQTLVERLQQAGIPLARLADGSLRLQDPDGNPIEV